MSNPTKEVDGIKAVSISTHSVIHSRKTCPFRSVKETFLKGHLWDLLSSGRRTVILLLNARKITVNGFVFKLFVKAKILSEFSLMTCAILAVYVTGTFPFLWLFFFAWIIGPDKRKYIYDKKNLIHEKLQGNKALSSERKLYHLSKDNY